MMVDMENVITIGMALMPVAIRFQVHLLHLAHCLFDVAAYSVVQVCIGGRLARLLDSLLDLRTGLAHGLFDLRPKRFQLRPVRLQLGHRMSHLGTGLGHRVVNFMVHIAKDCVQPAPFFRCHGTHGGARVVHGAFHVAVQVHGSMDNGIGLRRGWRDNGIWR